jgi:bacteriocin-like protein
MLHRKTIERRQYSDWSMGFKRISDKELQNVEGLRDFSVLRPGFETTDCAYSGGQG